MPVSLPSACPCPVESKFQLLVRLNNNFVTLFRAMATDFEGVVINPQSCGCTEMQILAALNANLVEFGRVFTGGGGSGDVTLAGDNAFTGDNSFAGTSDFNGDVTAEQIDADVVNVGAIAMNAALATDDTYAGLTIVGKNAGATIAQWEAVYLGAGLVWLLADANGSGTYPAGGLAVAAATNGNPATVLTRGIVRNDAWNWSAGRIYLSATAGGLTQTPPATSGDKVQDVGFALTADVAYFDFNGTYLTVA